MPDILANPTAFTGGLPWADATGFNNGGMDDVAVRQAVAKVQSLAAGKGIVYAPGLYTFHDTVHIPDGVRVIGNGIGSCTVFTAAQDKPLFSLDGYESSLEDCAIVGRHFGTQPACVIAATASEAVLRRVRGGFGFNVVLDQGADTIMEGGCNFSFAYGDAVVKKSAGNGFYDRVKLDQGFPVSEPSAATRYAGWAARTSYAAGTCVIHPATINGVQFVLQCASAGTSGPSAPALANYGTAIADGSAQWLLLGTKLYAALYITGSANQMEVLKCDITFTGFAAVMVDATGDQHQFTYNTPAIATIAFLIGGGAGHQINDNTLQDGVRGTNNLGYGVLFQNTAGGSHDVSGNLIRNYDYGVYHNSVNGTADNGVGTTVHHNRIFGCRSAALRATAGVGGFSWQDNKCGASNDFGASGQAAVIDAGSGSNITVTGNDGRGSGAPSFGSLSGASNMLSPNNW